MGFFLHIKHNVSPIPFFHILPAVLCLIIFIRPVSQAQNSNDVLTSPARLETIVEYALSHQPEVIQAQIDEEITERAISGKLADWYPQLNFTYNYQHFIDLQASVIGGNVIRFGVNNTSSLQFGATQNIFNRDVLLASSTASLVRAQADLNTQRRKTDVVVNVTKAFYDALATQQQIEVTAESVVRLERSLKDAQSRYNSGVSDKTDYKRATILLGNARATLTANREVLKFKDQYLKTLMGYPQEQDLALQYELSLMENDIYLDTLQEVTYSSHVDYQILQAQRTLQEANVRYSKWALLPSVSLFGTYNLNYQNDNFSELYDVDYPFSYVGASVALPIAQGGKRFAKIKEATLGAQRLEVGLKNLRSGIGTEYSRAMAAYKSNLAVYLAQKENVILAEEVYDVVSLQYQNGVKTFLDVTVAESDLNTTRISYYNSLFMVMASKMDVRRALGQINY